jgi:phage anti-repressor protein
MELQILVSKKGTKVVAASNLYQVLELPKAQYVKNLKKWLTNVYEFRDGIRKPIILQDYSKRKMPANILFDDYYISVELAKKITLMSSSKKKHKYAKHLLSLEDKVENAELLSKDQVMAVLELSKVMGVMSCQTASEEAHLRTYELRNGGSSANWWNFRSQLYGYSGDTLRRKVESKGKSAKGKTIRQMLAQADDKYEMVRTGVVDLFMSLGKSERYARNLGDLAKEFAKELKVEIYDDRKSGGMFAPKVNPEMMNAVKTGGGLSMWQS